MVAMQDPTGLQPRAGLLVLPGWADDDVPQFNALRSRLQELGWASRRARLPDGSWPEQARSRITRQDALMLALADHYEFMQEHSTGLRPLAVLGFSFGAYVACFLAVARQIDLLVLRSPALYPDDDWSLPKEELDKRELRAYRQQVHPAADNRALACCARFTGHVLLIDSECDEVIPPETVRSFEGAFVAARSLSRITLLDADHVLSHPSARTQYHSAVVSWLTKPRFEHGA